MRPIERTEDEWVRLALNTICPYCYAPPKALCLRFTPARHRRLEKPHKTRVTAAKKGATL